MDIVPPAPAKDLFLLMHCSEPSGPREANSYCKVMIFKTDGLRRVKSEQLLRDVESRKVYKHLLQEAEKWRKKVKELEEGLKEFKMESLQHSLRHKLYFNELPSEWQTDHIEKNTILCTITNTESRSLPYLDDPNDDADDDAEDEFEDEEEFGNQIKFLSKRIIGMKLELKYLEPYLQSTQEMYARQAKMPYCKLICVGHPTEEHVPCQQRPSTSLSSATKSTYQEEMHLLRPMPSACSASESTGQGKSTKRCIPLQLRCESTQRPSQNLRLSTSLGSATESTDQAKSTDQEKCMEGLIPLQLGSESTRRRVTMEDMPPEFRFHPTEEELVSFYLKNKLDGTRQDLNRLMDRVIPIVDIYDYNPADLPQFSLYLCHKDPEQWFFFIPRQESKARGGRLQRLTTTGYWKATGSPVFVYSSKRPIGVKRTMVFYNGRAPSGKKTEWKMNEYKAIDGEASSSTAAAAAVATPPALRHEFSLCRVYKTSKCLRSFDRRPPPALPPPQPSATQQVLSAVAGTSQQNPQMEDQRMESSPESSSSGEQGNTPSHLAGQTSDSKMIGDEELFLDLDEFWDL